jgi:hypothetical protein
MICQNLDGVVYSKRRGARDICIKTVMNYSTTKYHTSSVLGFIVFYDITYCQVASHDVSSTARNAFELFHSLDHS